MNLDTLEASSWDVVIAGTGLPQSLLALALSRSGKSILHIDPNDYYGGREAALSLTDAEIWAKRNSATVVRSDVAKHRDKLAQSRAYSLALAPQLLYARSALLPALVSSRTHTQLDFQAVGSWFIVRPGTTGVDEDLPQLTKVPGGREDVFQDTTLDLKAKRSLMKLLRYVTAFEEQESWQEDQRTRFSSFLQEKFGLPLASIASILALTLDTSAREEVSTGSAIPRIAKHLSSIGLFGPGFGALLPKWGGLAEICQVACRACAVGGGVYVLNKGIESAIHGEDNRLSLTLSGGESVSTSWVVGCPEDLPSPTPSPGDHVRATISRSISIVSSPLSDLFPPTSEGGVTPVGAVVMVPSTTLEEPPVFIFVHSSDSGECPAGQSVLYASVALNEQEGFDRLSRAVSSLIKTDQSVSPLPEILWTIQYSQSAETVSPPSPSSQVLALSPLSLDLALQDAVLDDVKAAWLKITHEDPLNFLRFAEREGTSELDDEDD